MTHEQFDKFAGDLQTYLKRLEFIRQDMREFRKESNDKIETLKELIKEKIETSTNSLNQKIHDSKIEILKEIMCGKKALEIFSNRRAVKTTHPIMSKFLSSLENEEWKRGFIYLFYIIR